MAIARNAPYPGMNFVVDLGTGKSAMTESGVAEVVFPEARIQAPEYRNGNDKVNFPRKSPTLTHYGNLVIRRGTIGSLEWFQWWKRTRDGDDAVQTVTVRLISEDHEDTVLTWKFKQARPVMHTFAPLNALGDGPLMETLEIAFDSLEME